MSLQKTIVTIFFVILNILLSYANALTAEDCKTRALNAYDNMAAVGGNDTDKQKLGAYAAGECAKEMKNGSSSSSASGSNSDGKSVIGLIFAILVLCGLGYAGFSALASLESKTRNMIMGSIAGVVGVLFFTYYYQQQEKKSNLENISVGQVSMRKEAEKIKRDIAEEIKLNAEPIRSLIEGSDKKLLAGSRNFEELYSKYYGAKNGAIFSPDPKSKYISVPCASKPNLCDLINTEHPIVRNLAHIAINYCNTAYSKNGKNGDFKKFIITVISFRYLEVGISEAVLSGLVLADINFDSDKIGFELDQPSGKELSIFWKKSNGKIDLCGNTSYSL